MKILIAVPTFETIEPEVYKAIYDLDTGGHDVRFEYVKGYDCARARNEIGNKAIDGGYDYVLMVDSDTIIPRDTLQRFLERPELICAGVCPRKNTTTKETALVKLGTADFVDCWFYHELVDDRIRIKGAGFACVLIDTEVFRQMEFPWFSYVTWPNGTALSEDYYFCEQAEKYGIQIWADTRVRCGHLARYFQWE